MSCGHPAPGWSSSPPCTVFCDNAAMCGRFSLTAGTDQIVGHFGVADPPLLAPRYNIAPSTDIAVIRLDGNTRHCELMRWGLVPAWSKQPETSYSTINARAETVAEKPAFRDAFRKRRCLIPATGFYEWQQHGKEKIPYHIHRQDNGLFAFAGLWERWQKGEQLLDSCTIIVTVANELMKPLHSRMPVILPAERYEDWLAPSTPATMLHGLLIPFVSDALDATPVSRVVNNPANDTPECIAPRQT
jgi:putative SOS response-associated peptidase YedK